MTRRAATAALWALLFAVSACGDEGGDSPDTDTDRWTLVWSDEFDGAAGALPDPAKWRAEIGGDGWGNDELQYYTDRAENAALDGQGMLRIVAREESFDGRAYTSARYTTQGLFEQRYGRFEARISFPEGAGTWPAFWMLGTDIGVVGWPECGEIDIVEHVGRRDGVIYGTVHGPGYSAGQSVGGETSVAGGDITTFRDYAVEWEPERIAWFVDGVEYFSVTPDDVPGRWPYDQPFFLILNLAIGGTFGGPVGAETPFPAEMRVDWVRVWELADD